MINSTRFQTKLLYADPYTARDVPNNSGLSDLDFTRGLIATRALKAASKDHVFVTMVNSERSRMGPGIKFIAGTAARRALGLS